MSEEEKRIDRLAAFIHRYRFVFLGILVAVVVGLVGVLGYVEIQKSRTEESVRRIEEVLRKVSQWQQAEAQEKEKNEKEILSELDSLLAAFPRSYAAARALHVKGEIAFEKKEYSAAAKNWSELADKFPKSHLAPLALLRVAVCKEEQGDIEGALETLKRTETRYGAQFPETPRLLFSIGRLLESKGSSTEAAIFYNRLVDEYPASSWTKLARNRLIYFRTTQTNSKS
ncbi:MAG: tetratricopeptide repeat protein [Spirochaetales bacterium]